jgi:surfeit locus 1 family protein
MYFRPFPLLTVFAIPILAALIMLGIWQSQRAGWKADQVVTFEQLLAAPPLMPEQACAAGLKEGQVLTPIPAQGPDVRVFGQRATGETGWKIFQAAEVCGRPMLVQTDFDALKIGGPGGQLPTPPPPPADRFIVQSWPERSFMSNTNSPEKNQWYWYDAPALATAVNQPSLDARFLVVPLDGTPDFLVRTPPETHVGYAVTWFGMAIAFVLIYGVFHARAGRLRFGKAQKKAGE